MTRYPALWTFAYNGRPYTPHYRRLWREIISIHHFNLWLVVWANALLMGAVDALFLVFAFIGSFQAVYIWMLVMCSVLTLLYVPNIIKLINYLRGVGYRG